jgi:uncharacterized integral membrane protein
MRIPQVKAKGALLWWGRFRFMYSYAVFYVGLIQLVLVAMVAYNTTLKPGLVAYLGWDITLWQYGIVLGVIVIAGMALEFVFGIPALIAVSNEQMYKHDSPIKTDFVEVKKKQEEIDGKLNKIMEHLGIEQ